MRFLILILLLFMGCEDDPVSPIHGCFDSQACNYNPNASIDNNSCEYAQGFYDCEGNCTPDQNFDCDGNCLIIGEWEVVSYNRCSTNPGECGGTFEDEIVCYVYVDGIGYIYNFNSNGTLEMTDEGDVYMYSYTCSSTEIIFEFDEQITFDLIVNDNEATYSIPCNESECDFCPYDLIYSLSKIN